MGKPLNVIVDRARAPAVPFLEIAQGTIGRKVKTCGYLRHVTTLMALITISGYPSSGKSRRAYQIKSHLESRLQDPSYEGPKLKVVVISDESLHISRSAYNGSPYQLIPVPLWFEIDSKLEKPARGALFTAMQRQLGKDTILIMDGLNYIKGFRYQMYCAARELKLRVCTVRSAIICVNGSIS